MPVLYTIKKDAYMSGEDYVQAREQGIALKWEGPYDALYDSKSVYAGVLAGRKVRLALESWEVEKIAG